MTQIPDPHVCKFCGELTMRPYAFQMMNDNFMREDWVCTDCYNRVQYHYNRNTQKYEEDANGRVKDFGADPRV